MSIVLDENTVFGNGHFEANTGLWSGSQGSTDFGTTPYVPTGHVVQINTTVNVTLGFNTYFKLQGFNPVTGLYEIWHCMNTPIFTPPSGDTLQNVSIIGTWTDR